MTAQKQKQPPKASEVKELKNQVSKLTEIAARAQADLQNFKSRMRREAEALGKFAAVPIIVKLLPIWDDLARASEHDEGAKRIFEKLNGVFASEKINKINSLGKIVDPAKHDVINTGPGKKDIIITVHEEGFEMHDKIIRPAKVQVGDGTAGE